MKIQELQLISRELEIDISRLERMTPMGKDILIALIKANEKELARKFIVAWGDTVFLINIKDFWMSTRE